MPADRINEDAVELACGMEMEGCALIADDGNAMNDVHHVGDGVYANADGGVFVAPSV